MQSVTTFFKEENDFLYRKGEKKKSHEVVESLITNFDFTDEQAAQVVKVDIDYVKKVRAELSK